jgi:hypothetical protein
MKSAPMSSPASNPESNPEATATVPGAAPDKPLSDAARRALQEAADRRAEIDARAKEIAREPERLGRGGLEPVRYNDWEIKGITSDF